MNNSWLFQHYTSMPYLITSNNRVVEVGYAFLDLTGHTKQDILEKDIQDVYYGLLRLNRDIVCLDKEQESAYIFTRDLDPREVFIDIRELNNRGKKLIIFREKPNSRLEESNMYLEQLCRSNLTGIAVFTKDGILIKANQKFLDFHESPYNQKAGSIGRKIDEVYPAWKGSQLEAFWQETLSTGHTVEIKEYMISYERGVTYWDSILTPLLENGRIKLVVTNTIEVTDKVLCRKALETQMESFQQKSRDLEALIQMRDEFVATLTHEFKTPLAVINAALQTIDSLYANQIPDKVKKHLKRIRLNSFRQLRLVNNLLDITRFNAGHMKMYKQNLDIVSLTRAITESVDVYARQKGVLLGFTTEIQGKIMVIDEEKYERILLNLLSNAIKFTPQGKSVHVYVSYKGRKAVIGVKDEGIGIPNDKLKVIFDRFGQVESSLSRSAEGTGIGLSLVKALVAGMGGAITVTSEPGKGSLFSVSIPATKIRQRKKQEEKSSLQDHRIMQAVAIEFSDLYPD